jgi:hypothetical protein
MNPVNKLHNAGGSTCVNSSVLFIEIQSPTALQTTRSASISQDGNVQRRRCLPQHRLRAVTLDSFSSTARLLACRFSASLRRHVTARTWLRPFTRLFADADFIALTRSFSKSPSRHAFASHPTSHSKPPHCSVASKLIQRHQWHSVLPGWLTAARSPLSLHCSKKLHNSIRFAHVQHPPAPTRLAAKLSLLILLSSFFFFFFFTLLLILCHMMNLTIDDGLELELDKMMTSFGAAALPQHRLRAVTLLDSFSSTARLLACRFSASFR